MTLMRARVSWILVLAVATLAASATARASADPPHYSTSMGILSRVAEHSLLERARPFLSRAFRDREPVTRLGRSVAGGWMVAAMLHEKPTNVSVRQDSHRTRANP